MAIDSNEKKRPLSDRSAAAVSAQEPRTRRSGPIARSQLLNKTSALTIAAYAALLTIAISHHEPWADEAQAWQIARTLPLRSMLAMLHYEGHPALWYLLLKFLLWLHVSYAAMHWVAGAIAVAAVSVLVLCSPFPRLLRLVLPFTYFLAFQYAVVARGYVLVPLLLFTCAALWPARFRHPYWIALLLGLLANTALHAAMLSGGLALACLIDLWLNRGRPGCAKLPAIAGASVLLLCFYGLSIWTARPARDTTGVALTSVNRSAAAAAVHQQFAVRSNEPGPPANRRSLAFLRYKLHTRLSPTLADGVIGPLPVAFLFWLLVGWKLARERRLHYLLPAALFVLFCMYVYVQPWHAGLLTLYVIALFWITWPRDRSFWAQPPHALVPALAFLIVLLVQVHWTEFAVRYDYAHPYSPGEQTARFLQPYLADHSRVIQAGDDFLSVAAQPYLARNVFLNQPYAFYWWSLRNDSRDRYQALLRSRPEVVVLEWRPLSLPIRPQDLREIPEAPQLLSLGYQNTHAFCGGMPMQHARVREWDCDLIFQPIPRLRQ